jgi:FkbM family methyltransferase
MKITKDIEIPTERFGSSYGGWIIKKNSINKKSIVYSFGIGEDASFDLEIIEKFGATVHAFDPTPRSIDWVKRNIEEPKFVFYGYGIADLDGEVSFNPPTNPIHVSHTLLERKQTEDQAITVPVKRLKTIMSSLKHSDIDILKMDIEGAEYSVVEDFIKSKIKPKQILIEYHHRFKNVGFDKTLQSVELLRSAGYRLFSISQNKLEFSFELI